MMKKIIVNILIITCFIASLSITLILRQQKPDSINIDDLVSMQAESYPTTSINAEGKININIASADELCLLTGIGPTLAGRIIQYREENGPYKSIDELLNVRGIGEKTLGDITDYICV